MNVPVVLISKVPELFKLPVDLLFNVPEFTNLPSSAEIDIVPSLSNIFVFVNVLFIVIVLPLLFVIVPELVNAEFTVIKLLFDIVPVELTINVLLF